MKKVNLRGRVLVVDDDEGVRSDLMETLQDYGYEVVGEDDCASGWHAFTNGDFDLAILDLRMPGFDNLFEKTGGISLLKRIRESENGSSRHTPVWILTASRSAATEADAFKHGATKYLDKADFYKFFEGLLADLDGYIDAEEGGSDAVQGREAHDTEGYDSVRVERAPLHTLAITVEAGTTLREQFRELLGKLFSDFSQIHVAPLVPGLSKSAVFRVECVDQRGQGTLPFVAKIGDVERMEREFKNFHRYVHFKVGSSRHAVIVDKAVTEDGKLGGLRISSVGTGWGDVTDLRTLFITRSADEVCDALENLFEETLGHWHRRKQPARPMRLIETHNVIPDINKLNGVMKIFFKEFEGQRLIDFEGISRPFFEPVGALKDFASAYGSLTAEVHLGTIHGDLNVRNVLVDRNHTCWILDFETTGEGPILRDFIMLETSIKYSCFDYSTEDLWALEQALMSQKHFRDRLSFVSDNPRIQKAFHAVMRIREYAGMINSPTRDMTEYYIGLLYYTLNLLRIPNKYIDKEGKKAMLLATALIFDRFKEPGLRIGFIDAAEISDYEGDVDEEDLYTVLIVDDEKAQRNNLVATFENLGGFRTLDAADSQAAVQVLEEHGSDVDLCLVDMQMGGLDGQFSDVAGLDLLRLLKARDPFLPVVVLSGVNEQKPAVDAVHSGAARFINKAEVARKSEAFAEELEKIVKEARKERLRERENEQAFAMIRSILPKTLPEIEGVEYGIFFESLDEVGGDFYEVRRSSDGNLGVLVGDAMWHGLPAAVMVTKFSAFYRRPQGLPGVLEVSEAFEKWNRFVHENRLSTEFITLFMGVADLTARCLYFANAGHPPPFMVSASGDVTELVSQGEPLGMSEENTYEPRQVRIFPGSVLVICTDGFLEAKSRREELYGLERLQKSVIAARQLSAEEIKDAALDAFRSFVAKDRVKDDCTLLILKFREIGVQAGGGSGG